ncbi:MAG: hypothetical protein KDG55_14350 [Rhodocyclaceae bacterium]|nr:hypothetical protein [Rhodocyclaceae bacterium]
MIRHALRLTPALLCWLAASASAQVDDAALAELRASLSQDIEASDLGAMYGAIGSITTAPEISAANYRVRDDASAPTLRLYKLPLNWTLASRDPDWAPYVQTSLGFMEMSSELDFAGERILSNWRAYGGSVGLGARYGTGALTWVGLASVGAVQIENRARYDGPIGQTLLRPLFRDLLFDWDATAYQTGLAFGPDYEREFGIWRLVARGRLSATQVKTFSTSSDAVAFSSTGAALTFHTDHSRPLPIRFGGYPTRLHVRAGATSYLGAGRGVLGFDRFLELGGGLELDVSGTHSAVRTIHLSALGIWGPDVVGWSLSANFGF